MSETAAVYWPLGLFLVFAVLVGTVNLSVGILIRPKRPTKEKAIPYECGMDPVGDANIPTLPRYYFMAMLLVLFDVEAVFLIPWAVNAKGLGLAGYYAVLFFFATLLVGYAYLWRQGDLEWD
jgi:NADH-quinone oxidoreductase subunit A